MGAGATSRSLLEMTPIQIRDYVQSIGEIYSAPANKILELGMDGKILSTFSDQDFEDLLDDIGVTIKSQRKILFGHLRLFSNNKAMEIPSPVVKASSTFHTSGMSTHHYDLIAVIAKFLFS